MSFGAVLVDTSQVPSVSVNSLSTTSSGVTKVIWKRPAQAGADRAELVAVYASMSARVIASSVISVTTNATSVSQSVASKVKVMAPASKLLGPL